MRRARSDDRGTAIIEMAIVVPLLVLLVFGTIDTSYYLVQQNTVRNQAREAARIAATTGTMTLEQIAQQVVCVNWSSAEAPSLTAGGAPLPPGSPPITPQRPGGLGDVAFVRVEATYQGGTGFLPIFRNARLASEYVFTIEAADAPAPWFTGGAVNCPA